MEELHTAWTKLLSFGSSKHPKAFPSAIKTRTFRLRLPLVKLLIFTSRALWARPFHQHALLCGWPLDTPHLLCFTEELWKDVLVVCWWTAGTGHYGSDCVQFCTLLIYGTYRVGCKGWLPSSCNSGRYCAGDSGGTNSGCRAEWCWGDWACGEKESWGQAIFPINKISLPSHSGFRL